MQTGLPVIFATGLFDSRDRFTGTVTRVRTVTDYELEVFTQDGGISHVNGNSYPIQKGAMLIAKPGDRRHSTLHFFCQFVHFSVRDPALRQLVDSITGFYPPEEGRLAELCRICEVNEDMEPDSELLAGALLSVLLCRIKKQQTDSRQGSTSAVDSLIGMSIAFMKQNYMDSISVEDIARHCSISTSHLHKIFAQTVHSTPGNYLTRLRLAAAKELLRTSSMPISQVADQCGFHSQAYFSDCFRRNCGVSPKAFRNASRYPEE